MSWLGVTALPYVPSDRISARLRLNRSDPNRCVARNSVTFSPALSSPQAPPRGVRPARRAVEVGVECEAVPVFSPLILAWESAVPGSSRAPLVLSVGAEVVPRFDLRERLLRPRLDG